MTQLLEQHGTDKQRAVVSVTRSGRFSRRVRVEWPAAGSWISFDSMYEYDFWLWQRHVQESEGIAHILRNTTKLPFPEPVTYETPNGVAYRLSAYRPDFLVIYRNGHTEWVEIKGWQNAKHDAIREAVATHYPSLGVRLITRVDLLAAQAEFGDQIEGWVKIK